MDLLEKAVRLGYREHRHIRQDKDLDPIRDRDDFKTLIARLETTYPPPTRELAPTPKGMK